MPSLISTLSTPVLSSALGLFLAATFVQAGEFKVISDVAYLADNRVEKLDLYIPVRAEGASPGPAAVWIHGLKGDKKEKRGRGICETLAAAGYACVSINYGPDTKFADNMLDCKNAVRFLRVNADSYGIDPGRIAVMGGSMGGYHALMVAVTAGRESFEPVQPYPGVSSAVSAVVAFYAPLGPPGWRTTEYLDAKSPPVLVLHGAADTKVPPAQSVELVAALKRHGVPHEFVLVPGVGHSFGLDATWDDRPLPEDLRPVLLGFLQEHCGNGTQQPATPGA